jgi:hypothetical protein
MHHSKTQTTGGRKARKPFDSGFYVNFQHVDCWISKICERALPRLLNCDPTHMVTACCGRYDSAPKFEVRAVRFDRQK